ncbi:MAG: hypothetical protein ACXV8O_03235 [Methylobacter sp.]
MITLIIMLRPGDIFSLPGIAESGNVGRKQYARSTPAPLQT